jgi:type II secretory pathway component GspD/PulD (secretin)
MEKIFRLSVFIVLFFLCLFLPKLSADTSPGLIAGGLEATISMDFQDASLKDVLKLFSIQSGLNFIANEAMQDRKVTLYLDKVPIKEAMNKLFKANNLTYEMDKDASILIVKDLGKPQIEIVTKVFYLKYASVSCSALRSEIENQMSSTGTGDESSGSSSGSSSSGEGSGTTSTQDSGITKVVEKLLTENGKVIEDFRTNSLIVSDIPSRMPIIAQTIAALDVPTAMVMLEVEMLDVSRKDVDKMGVNWGSAGSFTVTVASATAGTWFPLQNFFPNAAGGPNRAGNDTAGKISFSNLALTLDFLRTQTDTRYLARPKILTLNNETAEIKIVTNEAMGVATTTTGTTGLIQGNPERFETGVSLRITPQINVDTGEVTMFIYPKVSEATQGPAFMSGSTTGTANYQYFDPEIRSTKSVVRIKDGDTVIIGGLIRDELTRTTTKIPILGDIPILGALFRHKGGASNSSDKDKDRELLVFITPRIIKEASSLELAQASKVTLPDREQGPMSVNDRQASISSSLDNFERRKQR